jgi:formiminotetrahydrofolate cyclodeaminase
MASNGTSNQILGQFVKDLAAKKATPGGGAAAAVGAAVGAAAAHMAAAYTTREKDRGSGAAGKAEKLMNLLNTRQLLETADDDAAAYADLQRTWRQPGLPEGEKALIEAKALAVPVRLVETCHEYCRAVDEFLPACNPNITSDAKVGIHLTAGAARAAYQTVLVNRPDAETKSRMQTLLQEIRTIEDKVLELDNT